MKSIVRRDTGETYHEMLEHLAEESGIRTPSRAELIAFDRKRQERKTSNKDWQSSTDEDAHTKLKDGRTHMAYRPEHVVDLESGAIVSAVVHPADQGDTGGCIFADWPMWRSVTLFMLPGSIWGSCYGPCLLLAAPEAGSMLEPGCFLSELMG